MRIIPSSISTSLLLIALLSCTAPTIVNRQQTNHQINLLDFGYICSFVYSHPDARLVLSDGPWRGAELKLQRPEGQLIIVLNEVITAATNQSQSNSLCHITTIQVFLDKKENYVKLILERENNLVTCKAYSNGTQTSDPQSVITSIFSEIQEIQQSLRMPATTHVKK